MSLTMVVLIGVLVWVVFLAAVTALFVLKTRHRRQDPATEIEMWQAEERRAGRDRRIGLPDPRPERIERRRGDRRAAAA